MAHSKRPLTAALGAAFLASAIAPLVSAEANPFSAEPLNGGYNLASFDKHQDGSCGGNKPAGEGTCGGAKAQGEGSCGEKKAKGEGTCGGAKPEGKAAGDNASGEKKTYGEGKCGEGKCGEGMCGAK